MSSRDTYIGKIIGNFISSGRVDLLQQPPTLRRLSHMNAFSFHVELDLELGLFYQFHQIVAQTSPLGRI